MSVFESEECGDGMVGVFHETVNDKMEHDKTINQVP